MHSILSVIMSHLDSIATGGNNSLLCESGIHMFAISRLYNVFSGHNVESWNYLFDVVCHLPTGSHEDPADISPLLLCIN